MPIVTTPGQTQVQNNSPTNNQPKPVTPAAKPVVQTTATVPQTQQPTITPVADNTTAPASEEPKQTPNRVQSMVSHNRDQKKIDEDINSMNDDDFFDDEDLNDIFPNETSTSPKQKATSKGTSLSRMSEEERKSIISKSFNLVLGRDPADRDYSYYRFSTLTEDGLIKSLLGLPEHKQMVEKAKEHPALKNQVNELDIKFRQADEMFRSMQQELSTLQQLLDEKNRYIHDMREGSTPQTIQNNAVAQQPSAQAAQHQEQYFPERVAPSPQGTSQNDLEENNSGITVKKLPSPMDEVKSLFKSFFSKN